MNVYDHPRFNCCECMNDEWLKSEWWMIEMLIMNDEWKMNVVNASKMHVVPKIKGVPVARMYSGEEK